MAEIYRVECTHCRYEGSATLLSEAKYDMGDGVAIAVSPVWAWCDACNRVVEGEDLHDAARIDAMMQPLLTDESAQRAYKSQLPPAARDHEDEWLAAHVETLRATLRWTALRKGPPRCLSCGSAGFTTLRRGLDVEKLLLYPHGSCGGTLELVSQGDDTVCVRFYSIEGEFLRQEEDGP